MSPERQRDYCANLQFCCDHYRSVSEICRKLNINRQQFNRYLGGTTTPSRHNHKKISDFFGLEDDELFTAHETFVASFKRRVAAPPSPFAFERLEPLIRSISGRNAAALSEYQGFYFKYFYTFLGKARIKRELVYWRYEKGMLVSSTKQRYLGQDETDTGSNRHLTFRGVVGALDDRLFALDFDPRPGSEISMMLLYPKRRMLERLDGMVIGLGHSWDRPITSARLVMVHLGTNIDIRAAFRMLGSFDPDDVAIPAVIKRSIKNDIDGDETLFRVRNPP
jgi:transcriptional regulator with XRE-family HTH domain